MYSWAWESNARCAQAMLAVRSCGTIFSQYWHSFQSKLNTYITILSRDKFSHLTLRYYFRSITFRGCNDIKTWDFASTSNETEQLVIPQPASTTSAGYLYTNNNKNSTAREVGTRTSNTPGKITPPVFRHLCKMVLICIASWNDSSLIKCDHLLNLLNCSGSISLVRMDCYKIKCQVQSLQIAGDLAAKRQTLLARDLKAYLFYSWRKIGKVIKLSVVILMVFYFLHIVFVQRATFSRYFIGIH